MVRLHAETPVLINKKSRHTADSCFAKKLLDCFLDLGSLSDSASEVVQLSSANLTASYDLYLFNNGRVYREYSFDSAAVSYSSYSEGLVDTAVLLSDDRTLEYLDSGLVTLSDPYMYLYSVAYVYRRSL